jgi:Tfp pilus assembly protein PilF
MSWPAGRLVGLLAAAALMALAGCTTTTTTTSDGNVVPTPVANAADPERRAQARLELAGLYFARGQNQIALDEIRQALLARPDMPEAIGLRALVMAAMGDGVGAEASFQRAMHLSSDPHRAAVRARDIALAEKNAHAQLQHRNGPVRAITARISGCTRG